MFDVKQSIEERKAQGKHMIKFQVLGYSERYDVTSQLDKLGYVYDVYELEGDVPPFDIIVEI